MNPFEPLAHEIEICTSGKTVQIKSKVPIPCCWIKVSDEAGKIVFKKIENNLTESTILLDVKVGFYHVTMVTENSFATKLIYLK